MDAAEQIEQLARGGSVREMQQLLAHLRDPTRENAGIAARTVEMILSRSSVRDLVWLEAHYRNRCLLPLDGTSAWHSPTSADIDRWAPHSWGVLALASLDANGFARERAVQRLYEHSNRAVLPFIVFRLNDWVVPVRRAAGKLFHARLAQATAEDLIALAPFVENLARTTRQDHVPLRTAFRGRMQLLASSDSFRVAIRSRDPLVARAIASAASDAGAGRALDLLLVGTTAADPATARTCADALRRDKPDAPERLVAALISSPHAVVRVRALEIAHETLADKVATEVLERALHDRTAQVREYARFALSKRGVTHFRDGYLRAVSAAGRHPPLGSVRGLSEVADHDDLSLLLSLCDARDSRIREAALRGCIRLDASRAEPKLIAAVDDSSGVVRSVAWRYLRDHPSIMEESDLLDRVARANEAGRLRRVLRVLESVSRWRAVERLVRAHALCRTDLRDHVASRLVRVLRQTAAVRALPAQAIAIRLLARDAQLDARVHAFLEEVLRIEGAR
jgi:hypothetical protein